MLIQKMMIYAHFNRAQRGFVSVIQSRIQRRFEFFEKSWTLRKGFGWSRQTFYHWYVPW